MTISENEVLLRELLHRFIDHPQDLRIGRTESGMSCYWTLKSHPEDEGKLVGAGGSHVQALEFLIQILGRAQGKRFTFRLITEADPKQRRTEERKVETYDPSATAYLLERILKALQLTAFKIEHFTIPGKNNVLTFVFMITPASIPIYRILTAPIGKEDGLTVVEAIGTLFRAIAKKDAVAFHVEVAPL